MAMQLIALIGMVLIYGISEIATANHREILINNLRYMGFADVSMTTITIDFFKGNNVVYVGFFDEAEMIYEIVIKSENVTVGNCSNSCASVVYTGNTMFNNQSYTPFWIRRELNQIEVGRGTNPGLNLLVSYGISRQSDIKYMAYKGDGVTPTYVKYSLFSEYICMKGFRMVAVKNPKSGKKSRSLVDCVRECLESDTCYAITYQDGVKNSCYMMGRKADRIGSGIWTGLPFNIITDPTSRYCHISRV